MVSVLSSMKLFSRNLLKLLENKNAKRSELAKYCKISPSAVTAWLSCEKFPSPESLDKVASFFQIDVADLFIENPIPYNERTLLSKFRRLNDKGKDSALAMLDVLLSNADFSQESA